MLDPASPPLPPALAAARAEPRRTRLLVVTSLFPTPDRPDLGAFVARRVAALRARGVDVHVAVNPDFRHSAGPRHVSIAWRALTARGRFDGIEGHVLYPAGAIAWLAARLRGRPLLLYAHGADVLEAARRNRLHRALARFVARHADAVVTNSGFMAGEVAELGARAVTVVPPGVDFRVFRPIDRDEARRLLGLDPQALIALYVGHLVERKGSDVFAEAMRDVAHAMPSAGTVTSVGGGGLAAATGLARATTPAGIVPAAVAAGAWQGWAVGGGVLEPRLRQIGTLRLHPAVRPDEVPFWMSAADVVVVPSHREPLGLAAVEALACGVPVVASDVGGLRETVHDGVNGLLVPPGEPGALAAAICRLSDDGLRERLGAAARESVRHHDMDRVAEAMARVWATLGLQT